MRKFLLGIILLMTISCSGCSLLPHLTFDRPGVTPTSTEKSNSRTQCAGELKVNKETGEITCSKGYYSNEQNYKQAERTYTFAEKIGNWIRALSFWWLLILIAVIVLCPGAIGWLIGRLFNVFRSTLQGTVKAISNFRKNVPQVNYNGIMIDDPVYIKVIDDLLDALEVEHAKDPAFLKVISDIRLEAKIADND